MKNRTSKKRQTLFAETLEPRRVLDSTVVFNEIMFHPADNGEQLEFVELHNQMAVDMDISRWRIDDGIEFEFPTGTIVPGGEYVVVARDPDALLAATGVEALGPYSGRLSNNGETLELRNPANRRMDIMEFDDGGQWPVAPDGTGTSLSKVDKNSFTNRAVNWSSSYLVGGTPGAANFNVNEVPKPNVVLDLVNEGDTWSYHAAGEDLGSEWKGVDFNDDAWSQGTARFFAGNARIAGVPTEPVSGATASASSSLPGHDPASVVNGDGLNEENAHVFVPSTGTMWSSNGTFFGVEPDTDPEITFDLGKTVAIEEMRFWNYNNADSDSCCLDRGIAVGDVLVAGEDGVFTTLIEAIPMVMLTSPFIIQSRGERSGEKTKTEWETSPSITRSPRVSGGQNRRSPPTWMVTRISTSSSPPLWEAGRRLAGMKISTDRELLDRCASSPTHR